MSDYERIAQVIRHLEAHHAEQPSLAELAAQLGLSPSHFHRLFSTWAGVTPKDFLQCLTQTQARELLRAGQNVLDTTLATGLSGPGRWHDLCVSFEAASPGEIKSGGRGGRIVYGFAETDFGEWNIGLGPRGVCYLAFLDEEGHTPAKALLASAWPEAELIRDDSAAARLAVEVFQRPAPGGERPPLRAYVRGSAFQVRVWQALLRVPKGSLVSYGRVAAALGQPNAARVVGTAVGQNRLAYLIPCHRVIRETGVIGEYRWGHTRKQAMIAWETVAGAE